MVKKLLFFSLTLFIINSAFVVQAQFNRRWGIPDKPTNCETGAANMEQVSALMREESNPNGVIILVARLGKTETKPDMNRRRLFNISDRYKNAIGIPAEKVVATEGERVDGLGRVEIYWNGEMIGALVAARNADICVTCCPPNEDHYPDRDALERQQKQKAKKKRRG